MSEAVIGYTDGYLEYNGYWLEPINYNPLNLPQYTMRILFETPGVDPTTIWDPYLPPDSPLQPHWPSYVTWTQVSSSPNVWDYHRNTTSWARALAGLNGGLHLGTHSMSKYHVLGANLTGVNSMYEMFAGGQSQDYNMLVSCVPFDTSAVDTNGGGHMGLSGLFMNCPLLTEAPFFETSTVTNMRYMFAHTKIGNVPMYNTASVTDMSCMFLSCKHIQSCPDFNTSRVSTMYYMFAGASSLVSAPQFNTRRVTNMEAMFGGCSSMTAVPQYDLHRIENLDSMFASCVNVAGGALDFYTAASAISPAPSHAYTFDQCGSNTTTGAAELAQIPSSWGGTGA